MPGDSAAATVADWRQKLNGAFEGIEDIQLTGHPDFERLVVLVTTEIAAAKHCGPSPVFVGMRRRQTADASLTTKY
jgi:hypothetical protein